MIYRRIPSWRRGTSGRARELHWCGQETRIAYQSSLGATEIAWSATSSAVANLRTRIKFFGVVSLSPSWLSFIGHLKDSL
jgi:hypothetical protein